MILVDSSVLIAYLRGDRTAPAATLHTLETQGIPFSIPIVCAQEVLQGAADEREWELLDDLLSTQRLLSVADPWESHRRAARIFFDCRREGLTVRSSTDCLIAQQTLDADGILLHDDEDYEHIRQVRPLRTLDASRGILGSI
ncbi:MAG: PIN domain-containing protein [Acidobacteriota bacterium]